MAAKRASFGTRKPGVRVDEAVRDGQRGAGVVHDDDRAANAAVAHQRVAAEADGQQRLARGQLREEAREIVAVGGQVERVGGAARAPARVLRERCVVRERSAQAL